MVYQHTVVVQRQRTFTSVRMKSLPQGYLVEHSIKIIFFAVGKRNVTNIFKRNLFFNEEVF